jgi:hypothetical protein
MLVKGLRAEYVFRSLGVTVVLLSTMKIFFMQTCPLIALMLCFAIQSIAQIPTSEDYTRKPDETVEEYSHRTNELLRKASEEGYRIGRETSERSRLRRKTRDGYIMIAVVIGVAFFSGICVLGMWMKKQRFREEQRVASKNALATATGLLREQMKCPWCKDLVSLAQTRCNNCRLEIGWYEQIPCKPGKENECIAVWEQYQQLVNRAQNVVKQWQ